MAASPHEPSVQAADRLLAVVARLQSELHPGHGVRVSLASSLERELGFDSLARGELLLRVEAAFGVRLPEGTLGSAETPADFLRALGEAGSDTGQGGRVAPLPSGTVVVPAAATTLVEVLRWHAARCPQREHVVFLGGTGDSESLSYGQLLADAEVMAAGLAALGVALGQTVAIMLPSGLDFFRTFFGTLLAGAVPVPLYPPASLSRIGDHLQRQAGILTNCAASLLVTVPEARALSRLVEAQVDSLRQVATAADLVAAAGSARLGPVPSRADDLALLQYTSGSTGNPKGVTLNHANLLANIRAWSGAVGLGDSDVCVSWLPLYHDMGLIGAWLGSLYNGCRLVLLSPLAFLARPEDWLWAIHRYRGTVAAAPNFAYELCLRRLGTADLTGLDLSTWRLAANGAEPVSPDTVENFCQGFAPFGFRREVMAPVYGLAENAVGLAVPPVGRGPVIDRVQRELLASRGEALPALADDVHALRFVACGRPLPGHELRVVDADDRELPERRVGRLQFRGPSATAGYYRNPEANRRLFCGNWLETGDVAYLADGDLYLTSRSKDLIIRGGRNLYPYELEAAVGGLPGIRRGCVAVFGAMDATAGTERLVVVAETRETAVEACAVLRREIGRLAGELLETPPDEVVLAPPGTVLKTSSGKLRRADIRDLYLQGRLGRQRAPWLQLATMAAGGAATRLRRLRRQGLRWLFGVWLWLLAGFLLFILWPPIALLRRPDWGWALGHFGARTFLRLAGLRPALAGGERLPETGPAVIVCNHASYLDGVVIMALLRRPAVFVAKRELAARFFVGGLLRGIGCAFVERFDVERSVEDADRLSAMTADGWPLVFFPEGTFTRQAGLRPFRLGAFAVAARQGAALVPVALAGLREVLRDENWLPSPGRVTVTIGTPILPRDASWEEILRLRDGARAHIAAHCGEPDLETTPRPAGLL